MNRRRAPEAVRLRGIAWALAVSLVLWCAAAVPVFALDVSVCLDAGVSSGDSYGGCGSVHYTPPEVLSPGNLVIVCLTPNGLEGGENFDACEGTGGAWGWREVQDIQPGEFVRVDGGALALPPEALPWGTFDTGGEGGGGDGEFDPEDLDDATLAGLFAAGFSLVALSFAASKGFELVLSMLK